MSERQGKPIYSDYSEVPAGKIPSAFFAVVANLYSLAGFGWGAWVYSHLLTGAGRDFRTDAAAMLGNSSFVVGLFGLIFGVVLWLRRPLGVWEICGMLTGIAYWGLVFAVARGYLG